MKRFRSVDIAIAGLRTGGSNAHGDNGVPLCGKLQGFGNYLRKGLGFEHEGIGRSNHNIGLRVLLLDFPGGIRNAGRGVTSFRLCQNLAFRDVRKLLLYQRDILLPRYHPEMLRLANGRKPVHGELEQTAPNSQYINKLLGNVRRGQRPKPAANSPGHNNYVCVHRFSVRVTKIQKFTELPTIKACLLPIHSRPPTCLLRNIL